MPEIPTITFNNGRKIPVFGLGTWKSKPGEVVQAVKDAIDVGYRHFDCAHVYQNEKEVGEAIAAKIAEGVVKREDLFITSKLWNTFHRPEDVEGALKCTLKNLGLEKLDLYLIHWPFGFKEGDSLFPTGPNGVESSDYDYIDTWKAMEEVYKKGLTSSIGISNFNEEQITRLLEKTSVVPQTNQVECHPYLNQKKLMEFCKARDITITAYSPLGSPDRPWAKPGDIQLLDDAKLKTIAEKFKKSPAQILIRYQIQRGNIVIPKSVNKKRMTENMQVFDFQLTNEDMAHIDSFDCNGRVCAFGDAKTHKYYPF